MNASPRVILLTAVSYVALLAIIAFTTMGCGHVRVSPQNGASVSGLTTNVVGAMQVAADHNLSKAQLENCWEAYRAGDVLACPGTYGGYSGMYGHGDYSLYYDGLIPQQPQQPVIYSPGGTVDQKARKDAAEAKDMATDSIRMNKRVIRKLRDERKEGGQK